MGLSANLSSLRATLDERLAQLSAEIERATGDAGRRGREECADRLNQAVRRLAQAQGSRELTDTLADAASQFAEGAAVLSIAGEWATVDSVRPSGGSSGAIGSRTALSAAPALAAAIESREPVIAAAAESEIAGDLTRLAVAAGGDRVAVFPATGARRVAALVCAWGKLETAAVELLAQVAGAELDRLAGPAAAAEAAGPALIQIAGAEDSWENLPAREQRLHLRAQRFARVRVAEWRLRDGAAVRSGRAHGDLYGELAPQIDAAREEFRSEFLAPCPSMIDYLHREMLRTLAKDNAQLLGNDYPGPLL